MKTADIRAWLASDQPFAVGEALYEALGPSTAYKRLFGLGATAYSRQVLARELGALARAQEIAAVATAPPPAPPAPAPLPPTADRRTLLTLDDLRQQLRQARDERGHAHAQLTAPRVGLVARYRLAVQVLDLTDRITAVLAAEAHVLAHGRLPGPVPTADVSDAGTLRQRLANLRSRRSKLRARPDRADALAAVDDEIALIQSKLQS